MAEAAVILAEEALPEVEMIGSKLLEKAAPLKKIVSHPTEILTEAASTVEGYGKRIGDLATGFFLGQSTKNSSASSSTGFVTDVQSESAAPPGFVIDNQSKNTGAAVGGCQSYGAGATNLYLGLCVLLTILIIGFLHCACEFYGIGPSNDHWADALMGGGVLLAVVGGYRIYKDTLPATGPGIDTGTERNSHKVCSHYIN